VQEPPHPVPHLHHCACALVPGSSDPPDAAIPRARARPIQNGRGAEPGVRDGRTDGVGIFWARDGRTGAPGSLCGTAGSGSGRRRGLLRVAE
jgi:hypothetical protein